MLRITWHGVGVSQTFRQGVELRGREGWLGEQRAEAVTAGVGGRADPGRVGRVEGRVVAGRGSTSAWGVLGDGGQLAGPVRRCGQGRDGPYAARPPDGGQSADRAAAAPRVRAAEARSRGGDRAAADLAERLGVRRRCPFADLEALRAAHGVSVSRFAALAGIPERTHWRRLARHRVGDPPKGPWPAPRVDAIEAVAARYAADWPAWGHCKIAAMMRADGHHVSTCTVQRALRRRGLLLLPTGFRADRRWWARPTSSNTAISVWPLADPLLDWEVLT